MIFHSYRTTAPAQFFVAKRDGLDVKEIRPQEAIRLKVGSWSPDGHRFTYEAVVAGSSDIYTAAENGADVVRVTSGRGSNVAPRWSPDGNWVYFASNRTGRYEIWKSSPGGGHAVQITHNGGTDPAPDFGGRHLYYLDPLSASPVNSIAWTSALKRVPVEGGDETVTPPTANLCAFWSSRKLPEMAIKCESTSLKFIAQACRRP